MIQASPDDAARGLHRPVDGDQGAAAPAGDARPPGRRRDQRRRARRRPGDRAGLPPPDRRWTPRASGSASPRSPSGLLPGGGGVDPHGPDVRHPERADEVLLQGQRFKPAAGAGDRPGRRAGRRRRTNWSPRRQGLDRGQPGRAYQPWDVKGYKIPGGTPSSPAFAAILPAFPATLRKQLKGAPMPAPQAILAAAVEGAQVDFDTASLIETRYFVSLRHRPGRQEHDPGVLLRPAARSLGAAPAGGGTGSPRPRLGVLGAGMMGAGIAYACGQVRAATWCSGTSPTRRRERGRRYTEKLVDKDVSRGRMTQPRRRRAAGPDHPDRRPGRPGRLRPR